MIKFKNLIFLLIIFCTPISLVLSKKDTVSDFENRSLAVFPEISKTDILNRSFFDDFEEYISDHFPKRDDILTFNTKKDFMLNKPIINDTVVNNGVLLPYFSGFDTKYSTENFDIMTETLSRFNNFCNENNIEFLYVGIPEQSSAFSSHYNSFLNNSMYISDDLSSDFFDMLENNDIDHIDMSDVLSHNPDKYYSTTDHHFNFFGAYETYKSIINYISENYFDIDIFDNISIEKVNKTFLGSRNRKLFGLFDTEDSLYTFTPEQYYDIPFERFDNKTKVESTVFDKLNVTYNYYMGGDKAETIIKTNRPELKNILIIGDSFTNPVETLMYTGFNETRSIDLRYNTDINLSEYILEFNPDLIIYIRDDISFINNDGNGNLDI